MQAHRLTPTKKRRLDELNTLAEALTPAFDTDNQRALDVMRRAAQLLVADER